MASLIDKGPSLREHDDGLPPYLNSNFTFNLTQYEGLNYFKAYSFLETEDNELQGINFPLEIGLHEDLNLSFFVKANQSAAARHTKMPAVDDKETIKSLAKMASNSFLSRANADIPLDPFDESEEEWDEQAIRGYVYTNPSRKLVVFSIDANVPYHTSSDVSIEADKFNNNLMFSCCCARVDFTWTPVCPCFVSGSSCNKRCLSDYAQELRSNPFSKRNQDLYASQARDLQQDSSAHKHIPPVYYHQAVRIYKQLLKEFPEAVIWVTGYSTGGALAALLGAAFPGTPAIAFASPGERLFASRLGLLNEEGLSKMEDLPVFHFYNSADPIPNGDCMGIFSPCYLAGYALETKCHLGKVFKLASVSGDSFSDIQAHKLSSIIASIDMLPLPEFVTQEDCIDCGSWAFL
ncbi:lipase [Mitosporidium daphniae]|uniref:triacylglycerol lipase n=1 Tax=Mitosporidium daphniae TaxID=1485682 RepID=A0A098VQV4_9MICR|nr:lipase [Mitosporidium daphniae]KGG51403.1 lipase [Mitosporidium daphniae]|eukprot:XP_013237830.1 lipase [Mitosporidium daphniae]